MAASVLHHGMPTNPDSPPKLFPPHHGMAAKLTTTCLKHLFRKLTDVASSLQSGIYPDSQSQPEQTYTGHCYRSYVPHSSY
eukprot:584133-Amorphochlora_amoeboformis.AAC.1